MISDNPNESSAQILPSKATKNTWKIVSLVLVLAFAGYLSKDYSSESFIQKSQAFDSCKDAILSEMKLSSGLLFDVDSLLPVDTDDRKKMIIKVKPSSESTDILAADYSCITEKKNYDWHATYLSKL